MKRLIMTLITVGDLFENLGVGGGIKWKWIYSGTVWTGFMWLQIRNGSKLKSTVMNLRVQ
jgi:hypothetical protein